MIIVLFIVIYATIGSYCNILVKITIFRLFFISLVQQNMKNEIFMAFRTAIVLFSDDFRVKDNPALHYAVKNYENIIPLYIYNETYLGRVIGAGAKAFLHNVLLSFNSLLHAEYCISLIIKNGNYVDEIKKILSIEKIDAIYFNKSYTLSQIQIENDIKECFKDLDIQFFKAKLLFEPSEIKPLSGGAFYRVFTPFSKECLKNIELIEQSFPKPEQIKSIHNISSMTVENLNLLPAKEGKWAQNLLQHWTFDYDEIECNFIKFIDNKLENYEENRNIPSKNGNSGISPYLRFGILSPKMCFNAVRSKNIDINHQFILELLWREFAYHVMFYNQNIATQELKNEYKNFQWDDSKFFLQKWQKSQTGFDIIDAGMNELWHTGVMHNRVRMIVASFLIKDLLINWKIGEQWFWNTLVDADPAINPFSWQWIFGSGFDAAPYFRIFNPESQKKKFDPDGSYCKKWLPKNWKSEKIVSHDIQRKITLERYKNLRCRLVQCIDNKS
ncbi:cryptochrome/photolyase family protein [Candidatus Deianiraea vastatrix]|uniref:Deoxyribodipyrimidine photo-lyase n=1 Tax=Candidatus Deianiraea vastatrix TaxID=2163644 RepID=A0A5B8XCA0_9RICK|nr:deoxyribodipyrimidine photo-lyase [Candidatus Deianiraea vastatrix]QED22958.1 Deoxyribodipyrimidine photo-lyase [Candidatus Deianiraea vastatrix]